MKVLLDLGGRAYVLPNCKSIDDLLAMMKDAKPVESKSEHCFPKDGPFVADSAHVIKGPCEMKVHVVADDDICTLEEWQKRADAVKAQAAPETETVSG